MEQVRAVDSLIEEGAASAHDPVDVPALPELGLEAVGMAVADADEVDAPEPPPVNEPLQRVRGRIEALREALHE